MNEREAERLGQDCVDECVKSCPHWVNPSLYMGVILDGHGLTESERTAVEDSIFSLLN